MGRIKKYKWLLIVSTLSIVFGGVAYAGYNVAVIASSPSDQWHACVSNTGVVRASTLRLNSYPPSCPVASDTVHSWNAVGPTGVDGVTGNEGPSGPTGASGPSGATGERGLQASGPQTKLIYFAEVDVVLGAGYTHDGNSYGDYSEPLTGVDTSQCRSVSAHWITPGPSTTQVQVLDVEPISGATSLLNFTQQINSASSGTAYPTYLDSTSWAGPGAYFEWPSVNSGGSVGVSTSLRFRVSSSLGAATTVTKAWLRCVPF